jgi:hypothetical protein
MFRPSPCPSHYAGYLATMPSADFCLIAAPVTQHSAIGLHLIRSLWAIHPKEPRHLLTRASLVFYRSPVKQIPECRTTPDKNMNCPLATASLRRPLDHMASSSCANSPPAYDSYDVFVHQLAFSLRRAYCWCVRLPPDQTSRSSPCHSLVVIV